MRFCQFFDSEIDRGECALDDNLEDDPDYEASSSYENETPSVDPPVVSQPSADTLPSKNGKLLWSHSPLERKGRP